MQTECSADLFGFARVESRAVVAAFDGGKMTSDAGALLLGATDQAIRLVDRFAECFADSRAPELIEHTVGTMVGQRIFALALGYEDLFNHDQLRHDPTMAVLAISSTLKNAMSRQAQGRGRAPGADLSRSKPARAWLAHGRDAERGAGVIADIEASGGTATFPIMKSSLGNAAPGNHPGSGIGRDKTARDEP